MGGVSIWHWIVVGVVVMLLFGRGKVSELMGDVAKGIKSFKKGMAEDETPPSAQAPVDPKVIDQVQASNAAAAATAAQAKAEHKA
ncbi:MAG: twin-arginine translocase TatA/TatE family subunit [Beijerinckiaceae bacterium]|jgi:sec-independent protein translocase protein TatA|nr:twin-arginine translocase TatA/TatE family subunit [Beijerinckiaceae bacterium]